MTTQAIKQKVGRPANTGKFGAKTTVMRVPENRIVDINRFLQTKFYIPLFSCKVRAGGPVLSDDHIANQIDLHQFLVKIPEKSFMLEVSGESMRDAGIFDGDLLIVESAESARHGDIVVAETEGETTVKRLYKNSGMYQLMPENPDFSPIEVTHATRILGIVKHVIHSFK